MGEFNTNLRGTTETRFRVGKGGSQLKKISGSVMEVRDDTDAAYAIMRGLDPVGAQDFVTKSFHEANNDGADGDKTVVLPLALVNKTSTATLPDNAIIKQVVIDVKTAYDNSATLLVDRTGDASAILAAVAESDLSVIGQFEVKQITDWGSTGAGTVTGTISAAPTLGVADVYITYSTPTDIT